MGMRRRDAHALDHRRQHAVRRDAAASLRASAMTRRASAFRCVAEERLIGALMFGSRRRPRFTLEELAVLQLVADQIAIALERERLMTELQARNVELADADRRKDEFLAMLAHELRNPLAPIVNALHVARPATCVARPRPRGARARDDGAAGAPPDPARRRSARRLAHHARQDRAARASASTCSAVHRAGAADRAAGVDAREHELDRRRSPTSRSWSSVDATRMTQVVANLLNNAAKYTDRGGRITRQGRARRRRGGRARARQRHRHRAPRCCRASSSCSCRPSTPSDAPRRPRHRADAGQAAGADARRRRRRALRRRSASGCEFVVTIPLAVGEELPERGDASRARRGRGAAHERAAAARSSSSTTTPTFARRSRSCSRSTGTRSRVADDGARRDRPGRQRPSPRRRHRRHRPARASTATASPQQLRDIRNGKGFPRRLIAMTGYGQAEDRRRALAAGFDAHLVKPVDPELLAKSSIAQPNEGDR